jgi:hypothetical protein
MPRISAADAPEYPPPSPGIAEFDTRAVLVAWDSLPVELGDTRAILGPGASTLGGWRICTVGA